MKIFNHFLIRVAALPYESLSIPTDGLNYDIESMYLIKEGLHNYKNEASSQLLFLNQAIPNKKEQQAIQNIRKKIFQLKPISAQEASFIKSLPIGIQSIIKEYAEKLAGIEQILELCRLKYEKILLSERRNIQQLSHNDVFLKGVSLSSHNLFRDILKYQSKDVLVFKSDEFHTERSVFKYLTRIVAKTTPFSTFTNINSGSLKSFKRELFPIQHKKTITIKASYKISAFLVYQIKNKILSDPDLFKHLPVRVNKTLQKNKGEFSFITYQNSRHELKTVSLADTLDVVLTTIGPNNSLPFNRLSKQLMPIFRQTKKDILHYLLDLTKIGIIEPEFDIDVASPDWMDNMMKMFKGLERGEKSLPVQKKIEELLTALYHLKEVSLLFPKADSSDRVQHLCRLQSEMHKYLHGSENITISHAVNQGKLVQPERLIFEDTRIICDFGLNKSYAKAFSKKISRLFKSLQILDVKKGAEKYVYMYFIQKYPNRTSIPFLEFYETYFKDVLQRENESKEAKSHLPVIYTNSKESKELFSKWKELLIRNLLSSINTDEVLLNLPIIKKTNRELHIKSHRQKPYVGLFIQPIYDSSKKEYVTIVNSMHGSYGKMFSRFLAILPKKVKTDLRRFIQKDLNKYGVAVEINDSSPNNANIYPKILPSELKLPGGRFSHPAKQQIQLSEVLIKKDTKENILNLYNKKTNKRILPIDFGFQNLTTRLELFQFINLFSPVEAISHSFLVEIINNHAGKNQSDPNAEYLILPRIIYETDIVLQRKTWVVKHNSLPLKNISEDNFEYFTKISIWKEKLHLPGQVYIKRRKGDLQRGNDSYKPQYIDLNSPLHVMQLEKMIKKNNDKDLIIQEAMPTGSDSMTINGSHFSNELFIQIGS